MFYSHEILNSKRHGVSTVWILGTVGPRSTIKNVERKAIEAVDVTKACDTIHSPPGAPIALRLQASLLYGVSLAHAQQCQYVLSDAKKFRLKIIFMKPDTLDHTVAAHRKEHHIAPDDPNLDITNFNLPDFEIDMDGNFILPGSQKTQGVYSQLSPMDRAPSLSSSARSTQLPGLDLSQSPSVLGGMTMGSSPFGGSVSAQKPAAGPDRFGDNDDLLQLDDLDLGLVIDADGNMVQVENPELPQMDGVADDRAVATPHVGSAANGKNRQDEPRPDFLEDDVLMNLGEDLLPHVGAAGPTRRNAPRQPQLPLVQDHVASAPVRQRKKRAIATDESTMIRTSDLRDWRDDYLMNMEMERTRLRKIRGTVTLEQGRQRAYREYFEHGIGGFGSDFGHPGFRHPLAEHFAGEALLRGVLDQPIDIPSQHHSHGQRRSSSQALGGDREVEEGRRKRARLGEAGYEEILQDGQGLVDDFMPMVDDAERQQEVGREVAHPLSDQPSLPWHRNSSVVPGSSVKGSSAKRAGGQPGRQVPESPLFRRGSAIHDIERFSDGALGSDGPEFGDAGMGGLGSMDSSLDNAGFGQEGGSGGGSGHASSKLGGLSTESRDFLDFLKREAATKGLPRASGPEMWVDFAAVIPPKPKTQTVAALAFHQVLCLATRDAIRVDQEGRDRSEPFGAIHIGVRVDNVDAEDAHDDGSSTGSDAPEIEDEQNCRSDGEEP